jgi:hypothetical protein
MKALEVIIFFKSLTYRRQAALQPTEKSSQVDGTNSKAHPQVRI